MGVVSNMVKDVPLPKMVKIRQKFDETRIEPADIPNLIKVEFDKFKDKFKPGMSIAITCGSRGFKNNAIITKAMVDYLKDIGCKPFIDPAMGGHAGATVEGNEALLSSYGITPETMGCPFKTTMEVVQIGTWGDFDEPLYMDKNAYEADGIILYNRIKTHTGFHGKYESGLMKMCSQGLGKQIGATQTHRRGYPHMTERVGQKGAALCALDKVLLGVGVIENAYTDTYKIAVVDAKKAPELEPDLLLESKKVMGKILFPSVDVLIVDEIGKNISGDGMDPNITGTFCTTAASGGLKKQRTVVLSLTEETHGNSAGLGMADFAPKRAYDQFDPEFSYPNILTSGCIEVARIPVIMANDKEALQAAVHTCFDIDKTKPKIVRIKNTLSISELYISEELIPEAKAHPDIEIVGELEDFDFNAEGNLF